MATANNEVATLLRELADLTKLEDGSSQSFRVRAYERAVDAVRSLSDDISGMSVAEMRAEEGIGESTAKKIREYLDTGTIGKLDELRAEYPPSLRELTKIPGLGPKTVLLVRSELGVESVDDLRQAIAAERLRELPGLGATSEEKIGRAIERLGLHGKDRRTPIIEVLPVAEQVVAALREVPGVAAVRYCGSLRRFRETIADVDVLVASDEGHLAAESFRSLPLVDEVIAAGDTKSAILTSSGLQVDLRVVAPEQWGAATLYFTGSKEHNIALRQRAIDRGWLLNEYALADAETESVIASETEEEIYEALDLSPIPAPLREARGEIEAAEEGMLPDLVTVEDIRGDLHVHSTWSGDGRSTLDEMVAAAADRGLEYIAITEHGEDLPINGLSRQQVLDERKELERLRVEHDELTILHGAELNIARDGGLDYDDDFLAGYDWCVASVHSHFDLPEKAQTKRVITAMQHPAVNVIGHLTGRRIGRRPGIELDLDAVFAAAVETKTALEINCHLDRLDVPADMLVLARDVEDLVFVISTDAHHTVEYGNIRWGVLNSQRGWVDKTQVANTWPRRRFLEWVASPEKTVLA